MSADIIPGDDPFRVIFPRQRIETVESLDFSRLTSKVIIRTDRFFFFYRSVKD